MPFKQFVPNFTLAAKSVLCQYVMHKYLALSVCNNPAYIRLRLLWVWILT